MYLEDVMKIANIVNAGSVKTMVAKLFTVGLLAGAFAIAAPTQAKAQVAVGVRFGAPPVYGPFYHRPVYVAPRPVVGFYGPAFYGPRYDRFAWDHRRFDHRFYR
jgi:hypothetical protein